MYLIFDTETTGLPKNYRAPPTDLENWPRIVQLAWQLYDDDGNLLEEENIIIFPDGFDIPEDAAAVHGISTEKAREEGVQLEIVLSQFHRALERAQTLIAHNLEFDEPIVHAEFLRCKLPVALKEQKRVCTMKSTKQFCAIPHHYGFKWPSLTELHYKLFSGPFEGAHDAKVDVEICKKCFFELRRRNIL